nr:MFS transporter [Chitinophagaceae bacterium]
IATSGVLGTITAYFVHTLSGEDWRLCYYIGGGMGIALLFLRMGVFDSSMYDATRNKKVPMGSLWLLIKKRERFFRYFRSILIGLPVWYAIGVIVTFSDEFAKRFGIENFDQPRALMLQYVALVFGDMGAGFLSNYLRSRKKTLMIFYGIMTFFLILFFALQGGGSSTAMYLLIMGLGFGSGISVIYITMSAEQFGTNLRATAAISIPNLVRGFLPLILLLFQWLRSENMLNDYIHAAWITGAVVVGIGFWSVLLTPETFEKDLDYLEE